MQRGCSTRAGVDGETAKWGDINSKKIIPFYFEPFRMKNALSAPDQKIVSWRGSYWPAGGGGGGRRGRVKGGGRSYGGGRQAVEDNGSRSNGMSTEMNINLKLVPVVGVAVGIRCLIRQKLIMIIRIMENCLLE